MRLVRDTFGAKQRGLQTRKPLEGSTLCCMGTTNEAPHTCSPTGLTSCSVVPWECSDRYSNWGALCDNYHSRIFDVCPALLSDGSALAVVLKINNPHHALLDLRSPLACSWSGRSLAPATRGAP